MENEVKEYIDHKLRKFDGIEQSINKTIRSVNARCLLIEREQERLGNMFSSLKHLPNGLGGLEENIRANQIGLQNVYDEFKGFKEKFDAISSVIKREQVLFHLKLETIDAKLIFHARKFDVLEQKPDIQNTIGCDNNKLLESFKMISEFVCLEDIELRLRAITDKLIILEDALGIKRPDTLEIEED